MNRPSRASSTTSDSSKGVTAYCSALSPIRLSCIETCQGSISSESSYPSSLKQAGKPTPSKSLWLLKKSVSSNIFSSSSSMFCTNLYLSSSSSSEAHRHLCNLPFLPHPSTPQSMSAIHSPKTQLLLNDEQKHSEDSIRDFFNYPASGSDDGFDDVTCASDSLGLSEQLELQLLSDELHLAITDSGENPGIDEIYEASPEACRLGVPSAEYNPQSVPPSIDVLTDQNTPGPGAAHKPRMRWTPELHERFVEAVTKLGGPESIFLLCPRL